MAIDVAVALTAYVLSSETTITFVAGSITVAF